MTTEHEEGQSTTEDDFSNAFNEGESADEGQAEGEQEEGHQEGEGQGEQAKDDASQADDAQPQGGKQEAAPAKADDDPDSQTWKQRFLTLQGKYNHEVVEVRRQQQAKPAPKQDTGTADPAGEGLDEEERGLDEDYPALAKGIEKKAQRIAGQMLSQREAEMAPIREATQEILRERHFKAIRDVHGDFDQIVKGKDLDAWVEKQPSFVRDQYQQVLERGNAQSVVELLSAFKEARGATQQTNTRRDAAQDAMVVHTRSAIAMRGGGNEDKGDFSAGFNS